MDRFFLEMEFLTRVRRGRGNSDDSMLFPFSELLDFQELMVSQSARNHLKFWGRTRNTQLYNVLSSGTP